MDGYIYFLRLGDAVQGVKIGFSRDPEFRRRHYQSEMGVPMTLVAACRANRQDEAALHRLLAGQRLHGEWFMTNRKINSLIYSIKTTGKMPKYWRDALKKEWAYPSNTRCPACVGRGIVTPSQARSFKNGRK